MKKNIIIDVGSSTVKIYQQTGSILKMVESKSFHLKKNFDANQQKLASNDKNELLKYFNHINNKYAGESIKAYATGVFRKINKDEIREIKEKCQKLNIKFSVLSDEQEGYYLQLALVGRAKIPDELLLLNIGGATTEIVIIKKGEVVEKYSIELGVGTILGEYKDINHDISSEYIAKIKKDILSLLPKLKSNPKIAFFSGGELTFMQRIKYQLSNNEIFSDPLHPSVIELAEFKKGNLKIYFDQNIADLENLYPENPTWIHGSRSCEVIAETIFEKYCIKYIIPSDANLIDGIALERNI
jgi:exopolyphosphatase/pppGpp-phosphohydrolase